MAQIGDALGQKGIPVKPYCSCPVVQAAFEEWKKQHEQKKPKKQRKKKRQQDT